MLRRNLSQSKNTRQFFSAYGKTLDWKGRQWITSTFNLASRSAKSQPRVSRSVVSDSATPQTVAHQAPVSMGFSRQEYWSGLPFPSPEDLLNPRIEPWSSALQADSLLSELQEILWAIGKHQPQVLPFPQQQHNYCTVPGTRHGCSQASNHIL